MKSTRRSQLAAATLTAVLLTQAPANASALPGNLSQLGGQLGGQVSSTLSGIVSQLQQYLQQIQGMPAVALEQAQTYLGELMQGNPDIAAALGEMGIIDPDQLREKILAESTSGGDAPQGIASLGIESVLAGRSLSEATLGQDGQTRTKKELEGVAQTVSDSQSLATTAQQVTATDQAAATNAVQASTQAQAYSVQSNAFATQGTALAGQAQAATSTQDVLKLLSQQTANNGQIMSQVSAQLGGSSNQLGQLATQLGSNSTQNANSAALQAKTVELQASTANSLKENNALLGGATLNLTEMNDAQRGERIAKSIQDQAEAVRLRETNRTSYRLAL